MIENNMDSTLADPQGQKHLRTEIRERTLGYILAAFGLIAGLAWNDAIQSLIGYLFPSPENTLPAKFLYAVVISFIVVMISVYISRLLERFGDVNK